MHIKRLLLTSGFLLIITGCNTTPLRTGSTVETPADAAVALNRKAVEPVPPETDNAKTVTKDSPDDADQAATVTLPQHSITPPEYKNIWKRISAGLQLDRHLRKRSVKYKLAWYRRNQDYLDRVADRARPYLYYIVEELQKRNMPLDLALLPIVESAYHPFAYSPSKASGIWQFIPSTGRIFGLKQDWWYDGRRDVVAATRAALDYLQKLHSEFNGDWLLALAAYNTGEQNVARAIRRNRRLGKKLDFFSLRLPRETRGYVPSLLAVAELVANPAQHGVHWKPIPNVAYFSPVNASSQLDLALVARLTGQSMDDVYTLNPGFNRWATDPDGPHVLLVPKDKAQIFSEKLAALPENERISWKRHVIRHGESLGLIAQEYHISITALKRSNGIHGNLIHTGNSLLIPTSQQPAKAYTLSMDARRFQGLKKIGTGQKYLYKIQRGDTLWDIGQHYGVSVRHLCAWNGISSRSYLRPGQRLTLWLADDGNELVAANSTSGKGSNNSSQTTSQDSDTSTYTVTNGDSLWLIARRNGTTVAQLKDWNDISGNVLKPGQVIKLAADDDSQDEDADQDDDDSSNELTASNQAGHRYTVKSGDSLWLIARRFNTSVSKLLDWNNLRRNSRLMPGQQLSLIPVVYNESSSLDNANSDKKTTVINYTVKKGDSLWLISRRFGTTVAQLIQWNNLSNAKQLQPGQKLVLYISEA